MERHHSPETYFTAETLEKLRETIRLYQGRELFFGGRLDGDRKISRIEMLSQGNDQAVPVVFKEAVKYEVAIHNHPSGVLSPSDADVEIAGGLGNYGLGFYIVDNEVNKLNIVIPPSSEKKVVPIDEGVALDYFSPDKTRLLFDAFEERLSQTEMVRGIVRAFNRSEVYICEAPTGTGKSMAYLVPVLLWIRNNREKVVIATHTINLQEQLIQKDIPLVKKLMDFDFRYTLVKGRNNYLCRRKFSQFKSERQERFSGWEGESSGQEAVEELLEWGSQTRTGDRSELSFVPSARLWDLVASEVDTCRRSKCPFLENCFYQKSRKEIFTADLLVVNHHILCADASLKEDAGEYHSHALLPAYDRLIIDEAHNLEEVATHYFGRTASRFAIDRNLDLLGRIQREEERLAGGLLPFLLTRIEKSEESRPADIQAVKRSLKQFETGRIQYRLKAEALFASLYQYISTQDRSGYQEKKIRFRPGLEKEETWKDRYQTPLASIIADIHALKNIAGAILRRLKGLESKKEFDQSMHELKAYINRLDEIADVFSKSFHPAEEDEIKWISGSQTSRGRVSFSAHVVPLYSGQALKDSLLDRVSTLVLTSATLKDPSGFDFFCKNIGVDLLEPDRVHRESLPHNFDYKRHCRFHIPPDIPFPHDSNFSQEVARYIAAKAKQFKGRTMALFTSYQQMLKVAERLRSGPEAADWDLLIQGEEPRTTLVNQFKDRGEGKILLGVNSFWEGVDIKGDSLSCLIMVKIPFPVPSEPIHEARIEHLEKAGHNSFNEYTIPQAVIRFKQGFGRLIRSPSDQGLFCLLDRRVITKNYGRTFLKSLPDMERVSEKE